MYQIRSVLIRHQLTNDRYELWKQIPRILDKPNNYWDRDKHILLWGGLINLYNIIK